VESPRALQGRKQGREDLVQDRIARRLGSSGWDILQSMNPDQLMQITSLERRGHLSDRDISNIRSEAMLDALVQIPSDPGDSTTPVNETEVMKVSLSEGMRR
jgi:hypothetical protein